MSSFEIPVQEITDLNTNKMYKIRISPKSVDINLVTKMGFGRDLIYSIPRDALVKIDFEKRLVPKSGGGIGRAVVGGMLAGGVGAVAGAASAKGMIEKWDIVLEDRENTCRFEIFQGDKFKATKYRDKAYKILGLRIAPSNPMLTPRPKVNQPRKERVAWMIPGGRVYHLYPDCPSCKRSGKKPTQTTVSKARDQGLRECGMCQEMIDRARRV